MDKNDFQKYLNAVDVVCINCIKISEENCEQCPVRITCDSIYKQNQVEELRAKANELGYDIVKKQKYQKPSRCICGCKPRQNMCWNGQKFAGYLYECPKCCRICEPQKRKYQAAIAWNEKLKEE